VVSDHSPLSEYPLSDARWNPLYSAYSSTVTTERGADAVPQPADFIITHARVLTQNAAQPRAEAVAVRGNRIVWVGEAADSGGWRGPGTRVVDGQHSTLVPGFIDSHFHLLWGCRWLSGAQLYEATTTEQAGALVREYAAAHPAEPWVLGRGLRYDVLTTRQQLDAIAADRPMYLGAYDGHTGWANTKALAMAGILHSGEWPAPNSVIVRDAHGVATGELREAAQEAVRQLIPELDSARERELLKLGLAGMARAGITSVHNMNGDMSELSLYAAMEDTGELTLRVYVPYHVKPETTVEMLAEADEMAWVKGDLARGGAAKFFMDGVLESYTALMIEPYADLPDSRGDSLYSLEHFTRLAAECDRRGLQIFVHCCGDGAVRRTLDGYEAVQRLNGRRDSRHRIEHIEVIHPDDLPRFRQLGVLGSVQPLHAPPHVNDGDVWPARAGHDRWPLSFAWRTLRNAGVPLAFGSDWPVVTYDVMLGLHAALNRAPWAPGQPEHKQTLDETLASYTRDAAYAEFMENEKGQLKPGRLADLVLLSGDLENTPPESVTDVKPVLTMVDGRVVFEG
jgi:predicted amidohydrolase YtcJ